jgi:antitoxin component of MazEF toxin-antitoxin module
LSTVVPMSIIKQWNLKQGDKLEWSWEAREDNNNEMVMIIRKVRRRLKPSGIQNFKEALEKSLQQRRSGRELEELADD